LPTPANPNTQIKEQPFAAALTESVDRTAGRTELKVALREAFTSASTAQPNTAALASMQSAAVSSSAATQQTVPLVINTPVSQNRWGDEFSQKITWLASSHQDQTAELHLNPPQLGPLDVVIKVSGDQATALFTSPHAAVREAIEQALPKLRDMLADNGITLGNTSVNDQTPREQDRSGTQRTPTLNGNDPGDVRLAGNSAVRVSPITRHNGIVDTFA
jgi:flagellar hook-length control protein FliK